MVQTAYVTKLFIIPLTSKMQKRIDWSILNLLQSITFITLEWDRKQTKLILQLHHVITSDGFLIIKPKFALTDCNSQPLTIITIPKQIRILESCQKFHIIV